MRLKDWLICIVVALCVGLYLVYAPSYIHAGISTDKYASWMAPERESYTGIIRVWHIVRFRPYAGSASDWLRERAKELEKKHNGVYVEVSSMLEEECEARLNRGERADVYSFPSGWGYAERFSELEASLPALKSALLKSGAQDGVQYAAPYMLSGYVLLVNSNLAKGKAVALPETADAAWLNEAAAKLTYEYGRRKTRVEGLAGNAVYAALFNARAPIVPYEMFKEGRAGLAFADLRAAGDLTRAQEAGKGFAFDAYPLFNYTDLVQYLGLARDIQKEKIPYANEFIELAFAQKAQQGLASFLAFPAVDAVELAYENEVVRRAYEALQEPVVPNAFLYQRVFAALNGAAASSLTGNEAALKDFNARIEELVDGAEIK